MKSIISLTAIFPGVVLLAGAFALFAAGTFPVRAGEVAMETLKIQHEGVGKAGHGGRYILTAPSHGQSPARKGTDKAAGKSGATTAHELSHTVQQRGGGSPALPQPVDEAIVGFEHGQSKGGALKAR